MVCTSCAPLAEDPQQTHTSGDHYGGDGPCSRCACAAFKPPVAVATPPHLDETDPRVVAYGRITATLAELGTLRESIAKRDAALMAVTDRVDSHESRLAVIETELREVRARLAQLAPTVAPIVAATGGTG
jgi:hypothetical protein